MRPLTAALALRTVEGDDLLPDTFQKLAALELRAFFKHLPQDEWVVVSRCVSEKKNTVPEDE